MSIGVALHDLADVMSARPLVYLVVVDGLRVKVVQVYPTLIDGLVSMDLGRGTVERVTRCPEVVLLAPPTPDDAERFTLIVDGVVEFVGDDHCVVRPVSAVLHRRWKS